MKKLSLLLVLFITSLLCSCSMPSTVVKTVDDRPSLAVIGAPAGALLFVDGINMGEAARFNADPNVLTVESGTHIIRVVSGDETLYEQRVFLEGSLKTIRLK